MHLDLDFYALIDARRPDLNEDLYAIVASDAVGRSSCQVQVLTWQELAKSLPVALGEFLTDKYGIVAA